MTTKMIVNQPLPALDSTESNQWGSGICDCTENKSECCYACWCHACFACKISKEYGEPRCLPLLDIGGIVSMGMRVSMRERYGIEGNMCNDCAMATFCQCCAWCQMAKEMRKRRIPIVLVRTHNL